MKEGEEQLLTRAQVAMAAALTAGADQAEVVLATEQTGLTRYAQGRIHQHVAERNVSVRVRAVRGQRVAVASGNQLEPTDLERVGKLAAEMARHSPADPLFPGLPGSSGPPYPSVSTFFASTAAVTPALRAQAVADILGRLANEGAVGHGVVTTGLSELAVVNSKGIRCYQPFTDAWISVIAGEAGQTASAPNARRAARAAAPGATGYASLCSRNWDALRPQAVAEQALQKLSFPVRREVLPGHYTVLLEQEAVAEMLSFLASSGLNGLRYLEERSLFSGGLGQPRYPSSLTLTDDALDPSGATAPFDFEGVAKRAIPFIAAGTPLELAWDHETASRAGTESNGCALPAPNPWGPMPLHLKLAPGSADRSQLLAQLDRGLLITRFHYVNEVDEKKSILTGMTRDGTFLVEGGEVVATVPNLRWVESIDSLLKNVVALGNELKLISSGPGYGTRFLTGSLLPALVSEGFQITGSAR